MTPKTFYISDIYESFLAVMLFLFLPVIVIPVVWPTWPKNHFLFVRNWLRFWILPSGWNFIKSHRKWIILGWILQDQWVFFTSVFIITIIIGEGGGVFTLFPCVCILCSLWNIKSISVFETRKKVYFIKIFLTLTKVFIS